MILKLTLLILLTLLAPRGGGVQILILLLGMSYNMPKLLSYKFQSPSIKIYDVRRVGVREKAIHRACPLGQLKTAGLTK